MVLIKIYLGTYELYKGIIEHLVKKQTRALFTRPFKGDTGAPKWAVDCRLYNGEYMLLVEMCCISTIHIYDCFLYESIITMTVRFSYYINKNLSYKENVKMHK